MKSEKQK